MMLRFIGMMGFAFLLSGEVSRAAVPCSGSAQAIAVCAGVDSGEEAKIVNSKKAKFKVVDANLCLETGPSAFKADGTPADSSEAIRLTGQLATHLTPDSPMTTTITGYLHPRGSSSKKQIAQETASQVRIQSQVSIDFSEHRFTVTLEKQSLKLRVIEKTTGWLFGLGAKTLMDFVMECQTPPPAPTP